jgi:hypothetical protein
MLNEPRPLARTNQKLIEELRAKLDVEAVERARVDARITDVQAKRLVVQILAIKDIQANPLYHVQDQNGRLIGEIATSKNGTVFAALRYRSDAAKRSGTFTDYEAAANFICSAG